MGVHGERQRGRPAMIAQDAQHAGQLVDVGSASAKFLGNARLDQARRFQLRDVLGDVLVLVGCLCARPAKAGPSSRTISTALRAGKGSILRAATAFIVISPFLGCWIGMCLFVAAQAASLQSRKCTGARNTPFAVMKRLRETRVFQPTDDARPRWPVQFLYFRRRTRSATESLRDGHAWTRDTPPGSYGQFCPVAMAAEIVCSRWTALVLRELLCGTTRFNDLRRGVPLMSPTLLSKRLKELEEAGVIVAVPTRQPGVVDYKLTKAGEDLRPVVMALGIWGQRWVEFVPLPQEPRPVIADVGHAPLAGPQAAAAQAHARSISCIPSCPRSSGPGGW